MWIARIAKDKPRFKDHLELIKFLCKDFWSAMYNKNIDNLRTNHRVRTHPRLCTRLLPPCVVSCAVVRVRVRCAHASAAATCLHLRQVGSRGVGDVCFIRGRACTCSTTPTSAGSSTSPPRSPKVGQPFVSSELPSPKASCSIERPLLRAGSPHTHHRTRTRHTTDVLSNYVVFPCGVIRGALSSLGLASAVTAEFPSPPTCTWRSHLSPLFCVGG